MAVADEVAAAIGLGTGARAAARDRPLAVRVAALAWLPAVGLVLGGAAALGGHAARGAGPWGTAALAVAVLGGLDGRWRTGALGVGRTVVELCAVAALPAPARAAGLLVAPALGRWALVVQCYGGLPAPGEEGLAALAGRARFREFGWASVTALGTTLALLDAAGLVVVVLGALATLGLRVAAYRRAGTMTATALDATGAVVEAGSLAVLAALGAALGRPA